MEVRQLRYFVAVAELEHFGAAAHQLHIVQPAVSKQIARLEREIGITLFDRSHRRATLTPDGRAFLPHARRALRGIDRAAAAAAHLARGQSGILRIGSSEGLGEHLERILAVFRNVHPDVQVELSSDSTPRKLAAVRTGELDAAVVRGGDEPPGVAVHLLWHEPLHLVVPAARAAHAAGLDGLATVPLARTPREDNPAVFDIITDACRAAGFEPRPGPNITSVQDLLAGPIAAGQCWTLLCASTLTRTTPAIAVIAPTNPITVPTGLAVATPIRRRLVTDLVAVATSAHLGFVLPPGTRKP